MERFQPPESEAAGPYWEGTRSQELRLPTCAEHGPFWYPRDVCPVCLTPELEWRPASGRGTVYACSTMPKPASPGLADAVPYVVALVALEEGVRMMSNVVGVPADDVHVGMAVSVTWEPLDDGRYLPVFQPTGG